MKKLLVIVALLSLGGCAALKDLDLCSALSLARAGHLALAAGSGLVCSSLEEPAKSKCLKHQADAAKAASGILDAGDGVAKQCRVPLQDGSE